MRELKIKAVRAAHLAKGLGGFDCILPIREGDIVCVTIRAQAPLPVVILKYPEHGRYALRSTRAIFIKGTYYFRTATVDSTAYCVASKRIGIRDCRMPQKIKFPLFQD